MSEDRVTVREVAWGEIFPATILLTALRQAINLRALVFAALAIAATTAGWRLIGELFKDSDDTVLQQWVKDYRVWPWDPPAQDAVAPTASPQLIESPGDWWN